LLTFLTLGFGNRVDHTQDPLVVDSEFWEHLNEHIWLAFVSWFIGALIAMLIIKSLHNRKYRIDYTLESGMVMRLFTDHEKRTKKWLIVNPTTLMQWFDVFYLCIFDRGKDKVIDRNSKIRIRILSVITIIWIIVCGLSSITLVLSAFEKSMDIFDYIGK
jgi:hypothetical protein